MPTPARRQETGTKHRTKSEKKARAAAEAGAIPQRERVRLRKPEIIKTDPAAEKYWVAILRELRDSGAELLDNLDSEAFAGYCSMLAMRDRLALVTPQMLGCAAAIQERAGMLARQDNVDAEQMAEVLHEAGGLLKSCAQLSDKRLKLDSTILSYADKLGLTPSGRARLAVQRAKPEEELGGMAELLAFPLR